MNNKNVLIDIGHLEQIFFTKLVCNAFWDCPHCKSWSAKPQKESWKLRPLPLLLCVGVRVLREAGELQRTLSLFCTHPLLPELRQIDLTNTRHQSDSQRQDWHLTQHNWSWDCAGSDMIVTVTDSTTPPLGLNELKRARRSLAFSLSQFMLQTANRREV